MEPRAKLLALPAHYITCKEHNESFANLRSERVRLGRIFERRAGFRAQEEGTSRMLLWNAICSRENPRAQSFLINRTHEHVCARKATVAT